MSKHVFITGGGRGIGRTMALELAQNGYLVSICSRTRTELEETQKLSGGKIRFSVFDATDSQAFKAWVEGEIGETGSVPWALIANAGSYGVIGKLTDIDFEEWRRGMELNLMAPAQHSQIFARILIARQLKGRIILLSGGGATQAIPHFSNYAAAKASVVRLGETLALELKSDGITVNCIAPGMINTRFVDDVLKAGLKLAGSVMYERALKQKNEPGTSPENAAHLVTHLLSEEGGAVTGLLISAIWDKWKDISAQWDKIEKTDWYRLRRMVPPEVNV